MALCLTRADGQTDESRDGFVDQLLLHKALKPYFDDESLFILLMGCADHKFKEFGSELQYTKTLTDVVDWRQQFFDAIFYSKYRVDLRSTCIFGQRQEDVKTLLETCVSELRYLSQPEVDFQVARELSKLETHHTSMQSLYRHKLIVEDREDCVTLSGELWELILFVRKNKLIKTTIKQQLLEPWAWAEDGKAPPASAELKL